MHYLKNILFRPVEFFFYVLGLFRKHDSILFLPHPHMSKYDLYDLINYQSDSTLTFLNYILSQGFLKQYKMFVAISDTIDKDRLEKYCTTHFPDYNITFFKYFQTGKNGILSKFSNIVTVLKIATQCEYIFSSRPFDEFKNSISSQKLVCLSYFSTPFKNDIYLPQSNDNQFQTTEGAGYFRYISTSPQVARLIYPTFAISYEKYISLGLCRNDNLLNGKKEDLLRNKILTSVSYEVKKIILYTPTHRDYDQNSKSYIRGLLGFEINKDILELFLKENKILIICKMHPKQNLDILRNSLPECIQLYDGSLNFGLTELMKVSDVLMTDYTSGYFDYLLLDKPVIFNFYDMELYNATRGFTYEPLDCILAGDIVTDELSFIKALLNIDENYLQNKSKRQFVRDFVYTHQDSNSCKRVYDYFFNPNRD